MQDLNNKVTGNTLTAAEWNEVPSEMQNIIENVGQTLSGADLNQMGKAIADYAANGSAFVDSGAADAYVLSAVGSQQNPSAYRDLQEIVFFPTNNNTGASTVNVGGLGAKNIKDEDGNALAAGALTTTSLYVARYNNSAGEFRTVPILSNAIQINLKSGRRNAIRNGGFDVNQRGTAFTLSADGYTSDGWQGGISLDGGSLDGTGTFDIDILPFTVGQTVVAGNPANYIEANGHIASGSGSEELSIVAKIEGVKTFAAETATFSYWVKGSITGTVGVASFQNFGAGGSPSTQVVVFGEDLSLTTSWVRHEKTIAVPSISGKTLGTAGDSLSLHFYDQAGATVAATYGSMSVINYTGDMQIANVQIEKGARATEFEILAYSEQIDDAYRYYQTFQKGGFSSIFSNASSTTLLNSSNIKFTTTMRAVPSVTYAASPTCTAVALNGGAGSASAVMAAVPAADYFRITLAGTGLTAQALYAIDSNFFSETFQFSAEL